MHVYLIRFNHTVVYSPFVIWVNLRMLLSTRFLVDLQSHGIPEENQLGCPLDDIGQLREYAN